MTTLTLHHGDCLEVMREIPDKSVDLIICDLPYGCLTGGGKLENPKDSSYGQNACAWDIKIDLDAFWKQVRRIRKNDHTPTLHFCTTKFGNELINSNPSEFRYDLVWDKQRGVSFLSANKMPMRSHEMVYVFSKAGAAYTRVDISGDFAAWEKDPNEIRHGQVYCNEIGRKVSKGEAGKRCPLSVIKTRQLASWQMKGGHPTQKPSTLYRWLIERYCPEGGTVLDPTFGSGNSVFTAYEMGRNAIGIEMDKGFYDKAVLRMDVSGGGDVVEHV